MTANVYETVAQAYLELLHLRGIDYFLANAGTDFSPIIDAFAKREHDGCLSPKPLAVPHETPLVAMAHGYAMVTGKPLAAMVHVNVGTANSIGPLIAAHRARIPMLFTAGRTPNTEWGSAASRSAYIHWGQDCFDQASMVREYVKWDYELRVPHQLESTVDRALSIALSEPMGPVYLTLPREVLASPYNGSDLNPAITVDSPAPYPDPRRIRAAADLLAKATFPILVTTASGRRPSAVAALCKLAETAGCGVISFNPEYFNFPMDHPCHLGFEVKPYLEKTDLILSIDCAVPWYPKSMNPGKETQVIHMGIDPLYTLYPMRSFPAAVAIQGRAEDAALALSDRLLDHPAFDVKRVAERMAVLSSDHAGMVCRHQDLGGGLAKASPIDIHWAAHCLNQFLDEDTVVINEYDNAMRFQSNLLPGQYFGIPHAGFLGWGMGAALGVKLARPEKTVVAVVGDGSYMFCVPTACHWTSATHDLPILTVVNNNQGWQAVKKATLNMYPDGWAAKTGNIAVHRLEPTPQYEKICEACSGYGVRVEDPDQIMPAFERAFHEVRRNGRQALVNIICSPLD